MFTETVIAIEPVSYVMLWNWVDVYSRFYQLLVTPTCYFFRCFSFGRIEQLYSLLLGLCYLYILKVVCKKFVNKLNIVIIIKLF